MTSKTLATGATTTTVVPCPTKLCPSDVLFELVALGGSTFTVTPKVRLATGNSADPITTSYDVAYTDEPTGSPFAAGTAITVAGLYRVSSDAVDVILAVTVTGGTGVRLTYQQLGPT